MLTNLSSERPPPMLGILLRTPWQAIRARIHAELVAAGFEDVRPRDLAVLQWPGPDGMRPIDIAAHGNMSKQAVKPLIDHLEARGYLERAPDPEDHRAQRIHTTPRGKQLLAAAAAIIDDIEQDVAEQLGSDTHSQLRAILEKLTTITAWTPPALGRGAPHTRSSAGFRQTSVASFNSEGAKMGAAADRHVPD